MSPSVETSLIRHGHHQRNDVATKTPNNGREASAPAPSPAQASDMMTVCLEGSTYRKKSGTTG